MPTFIFWPNTKIIKGGENPCQMLFSHKDTGGRSSNGRCKLVAMGDANVSTNFQTSIRVRCESWFF